MEHEPDLEQAQNLWEFKQVMHRESFFQEGHIHQVDAAYTYFLEMLIISAEDEAKKDQGAP